MWYLAGKKVMQPLSSLSVKDRLFLTAEEYRTVRRQRLSCHFRQV